MHIKILVIKSSKLFFLCIVPLQIQNTDKGFRIRLDLCHHCPEEVKISSDNQKITIAAKHEEKQDNHGFVSREMTRTYSLPDVSFLKSLSLFSF